MLEKLQYLGSFGYWNPMGFTPKHCPNIANRYNICVKNDRKNNERKIKFCEGVARKERVEFLIERINP